MTDPNQRKLLDLAVELRHRVDAAIANSDVSGKQHLQRAAEHLREAAVRIEIVETLNSFGELAEGGAR